MRFSKFLTRLLHHDKLSNAPKKNFEKKVVLGEADATRNFFFDRELQRLRGIFRGLLKLPSMRQYFSFGFREHLAKLDCQIEKFFKFTKDVKKPSVLLPNRQIIFSSCSSSSSKKKLIL
jgi:hypothetical protein